MTFTTCTPALPVPPPAFAPSTMSVFSSRLLLHPPCTMFRGHLGGSDPYGASTKLSLQDQLIRAPRQCYRAHQARRQHRQAGQAGRGEAGHGHNALCSASYSTTSPYLFLLTGGATLSLSSRLGRFSATERTSSLVPQLSWRVCQGWAENHRALVKYLKPLQLDPALGAHGTSGRTQLAAMGTSHSSSAHCMEQPGCGGVYCLPLSPTLFFFQQSSSLCWLL